MVSLTAAVLLASGLVASVQAGSIHAGHMNLHKRGSYGAPEEPKGYGGVPPELSPAAANATCGCTTYTTTWYGEATLVQPPPPSTTSTTSTTAAPTTTSAAPTTTSTSSSAPAPPSYSQPEEKPTTYAAVPVPSTPASPEKQSPQGYGGSSGGSTGGSTGSISANGNQWAMTYTPYAQSGSCKTADEVMNDIGQIKAKGFTTVRIYATDCSGPQNVGDACKAHGLKMILGVYIDGKGLSGAHEQINTLTTWGKDNWDMVVMVVCGNEAIFNGFVDAGSLADFINQAKSAFKSAGFNGPVTTTEPLGTIQEHSSTLCPVVDVIAANIHAFFNGGFEAEKAGDFVASQMNDLAAACNHEKEAYNLETGWPSKGNANGIAIPGLDQQKAAIDSILAKAGSKSAIFSFEDDTWKAPGDLGVEQYWGCAGLFSG